MPDSTASNAIRLSFALVGDRQIELRCGTQSRLVAPQDLQSL
jgi:hypothetical protein